MSPRELLEAGFARLQREGASLARHEVEWLLAHLLHVTLPELYVSTRPVEVRTSRQFWMKLNQRLAGVPLQYVLKEADFHGTPFIVGPGVFIPRPETEAVVETVIGYLRDLEERLCRPLRLIDAGTGSGCIAVTLAQRLAACVVVGVELSWIAVHTARLNVQRLGMSSRVHLVQGRWLDGLRGTFDGIISNPPYIPSGTVDGLPLDVRQEPRISLAAGDEGLDALRRLIEEAPRRLTPGGILALECGEEQVETVASMASWAERVEEIRDLAQRPRGVVLWRH